MACQTWLQMDKGHTHGPDWAAKYLEIDIWSFAPQQVQGICDAPPIF